MKKWSTLVGLVTLLVTAFLLQACGGNESNTGTGGDNGNLFVTVRTEPLRGTNSAVLYSPEGVRRVGADTTEGSLPIPVGRPAIVGKIDPTTGVGWYTAVYAPEQANGQQLESLDVSGAATITANALTTATMMVAVPALLDPNPEVFMTNLSNASQLADVAELASFVEKYVSQGLDPLDYQDTRDAFARAVRAASEIVTDRAAGAAGAAVAVTSAGTQGLGQVVPLDSMFTRLIKTSGGVLPDWNSDVWFFAKNLNWIVAVYEIDAGAYQSEDALPLRNDPHSANVSLVSTTPVARGYINSDWAIKSTNDVLAWLAKIPNPFLDADNYVPNTGFQLPTDRPAAYWVLAYTSSIDFPLVPHFNQWQAERTEDVDFINSTVDISAIQSAKAFLSNALMVSLDLADLVLPSGECALDDLSEIEVVFDGAKSGAINMYKNAATWSSEAPDFFKETVKSIFDGVVQKGIECSKQALIDASLTDAAKVIASKLINQFDLGVTLGSTASWAIAMANVPPVESYYVVNDFPWVEIELLINGEGSVQVNNVTTGEIQQYTESRVIKAHAGDTIELTATPGSGWEFAGWQRGSSTLSSPTIRITPEGKVFSEGVSATFQMGNGPQIAVSPSPIRATAEVGGTTREQLTITNTGGEDLVVNAIQPSQSWISPLDTGPFTVPAGNQHFIDIDLTCDNSNTRSGEMSITSNDPNHPTYTVAVTLTCEAPQNNPPELSRLMLETNGDGQESGVSCDQGLIVAGDTDVYVRAYASDPDGDQLTYWARKDGGSWIDRGSSNSTYMYIDSSDHSTHTIDMYVEDANGGVSSTATCSFRLSYTPEIVDFAGPETVEVHEGDNVSWAAHVKDQDYQYPKYVTVIVRGRNGTPNPFASGKDMQRLFDWDSSGVARYALGLSGIPAGDYYYLICAVDSYGVLTDCTNTQDFSILP